MSHDTNLIKALDALRGTASHRPDSTSDAEILVTMSDLAEVATLVGRLAAHSQQDLAEWVTVGSHLAQAQNYAEGLARCLKHACGTLAFNTAAQPVAV